MQSSNEDCEMIGMVHLLVISTSCIDIHTESIMKVRTESLRCMLYDIC